MLRLPLAENSVAEPLRGNGQLLSREQDGPGCGDASVGTRAAATTGRAGPASLGRPSPGGGGTDQGLPEVTSEKRALKTEQHRGQTEHAGSSGSDVCQVHCSTPGGHGGPTWTAGDWASGATWGMCPGLALWSGCESITLLLLKRHHLTVVRRCPNKQQDRKDHLTQRGGPSDPALSADARAPEVSTGQWPQEGVQTEPRGSEAAY